MMTIITCMYIYFFSGTEMYNFAPAVHNGTCGKGGGGGKWREKARNRLADCAASSAMIIYYQFACV